MEFLSSARVGRERHILVLEGRAIPPAGRNPSTALGSYTYFQANHFIDPPFLLYILRLNSSKIVQRWFSTLPGNKNFKTQA